MLLLNLLLSFIVDGIFTEDNNEEIGKMVDQVIDYVTMPISFSWGQTFMIYFQGIALIIAFAVIIIKGISNGILINGGSEDESVGHYIYRSCWPIAIIAATPTLMGVATQVAGYIIDDLMLSATGIDYGALIKAVLVLNSSLPGTIVGIIGEIAVIYYTFTVVFQCVKRQIQLTVLSIIGPLVAASTVSDNNSGDFITLIKEMAGTAVITVLQLTLLISAIALPATMGFQSAIPVLMQPFIIIGVFSAIKQLPKWVERYTLAPQVSGGGGGRFAVAASSIGRSLISKAVGR